MLLAVLCVASLAFAASPAPTPLPSRPIRPTVPPGWALAVMLREPAKLLRDPGTLAWLDRWPQWKRVAEPLPIHQIHPQAPGFRAIMAVAGLTPEVFLSEVLGQGVWFVYYPAVGPDQPEAGLFLLKPNKIETAQKLVRWLDQIQSTRGELREVREETDPASGRSYVLRQKTTGEQEAYAFHDGWFVFATRADWLPRYWQADPRQDTLGPALARLQAEDAPLLGWLDPQAPTVLADLQKGVDAAATDSERAFLKQMLALWQKLDGVGLRIDPGQTLQVSLLCSWKSKALPPEQTPVRMGLKPAPRLQIRPDAWLTAQIPLEIGPTWDVLQRFLPEATRQETREQAQSTWAPIVGRDLWPLFLEQLGPRARWELLPPRDGQHWPEWTLAWEWPRREGAPEPLEEGLDQALEFVAQQIRLGYNRDHEDQLRLRRIPHPEGTRRVFESQGGFATGWQPTIGLTGGFLVLASHPQTHANFRAESAPGAAPLTPLGRVRPAAAGAGLGPYQTRFTRDLARWTGEPLPVVQNTLGSILDTAADFSEGDWELITTPKRWELRLRLTLQADSAAPKAPR